MVSHFRVVGWSSGPRLLSPRFGFKRERSFILFKTLKDPGISLFHPTYPCVCLCLPVGRQISSTTQLDHRKPEQGGGCCTCKKNLQAYYFEEMRGSRNNFTTRARLSCLLFSIFSSLYSHLMIITSNVLLGKPGHFGWAENQCGHARVISLILPHALFPVIITNTF